MRGSRSVARCESVALSSGWNRGIMRISQAPIRVAIDLATDFDAVACSKLRPAPRRVRGCMCTAVRARHDPARPWRLLHHPPVQIHPVFISAASAICTRGSWLGLVPALMRRAQPRQPVA